MKLDEAYQRLADELAQDDHAFPVDVRIAQKIRAALDDPECGIEEASRHLQADPMLSARVVALANSALHDRGGKPVTDVRTALARIGLNQARSLSIAHIARQLAGPLPTPHQQQAAQALWRHTTQVAALAQLIAQRITHVNADTAIFAGLVHEAGGFYLISRSGRLPTLLQDENPAWLNSGEAQLGQAVLNALAIPEEIRSAIRTCWDGYLAFPPTTLGDTLMLADALATHQSPFHGGAGHPENQAAAQQVSMLVGEETLTEILETSAHQVSERIAALQ